MKEVNLIIKLRQFVANPWVNNFFFLILGLFLSVPLKNIPEWAIPLLVLLTALCLVILIYNIQYVFDNLKLHVTQVERLLGAPNEVISEPDFPQFHSDEYKGVCYSGLIDLIKSAKKTSS
jgi:hypothetical protein